MFLKKIFILLTMTLLTTAERSRRHDNMKFEFRMKRQQSEACEAFITALGTWAEKPEEEQAPACAEEIKEKAEAVAETPCAFDPVAMANLDKAIEGCADEKEVLEKIKANAAGGEGGGGGAGAGAGAGAGPGAGPGGVTGGLGNATTDGADGGKAKGNRNDLSWSVVLFAAIVELMVIFNRL